MTPSLSQPIPLHLIRLAASEVLACSVLDLFPGAKLISGKVSDVGFHYDFLIEQPISEEMANLIEEKMRGLIKENLRIEMMEMMRENAIEMFRHQNQPFKMDELKNYSDNIVQIWKMGTFYDVCVGQYPASTGIAEAFKLQNIRRQTISLPFYDKKGEKKYERAQVIRIKGTACADKSELKKFLKKLEAFKKYDHRVLGPEMGVFSFIEENLFWPPAGEFIKDELINYFKTMDRQLQFERVSTPKPFKKSVAHAKLYKLIERTADDLPIRYSEISEQELLEKVDFEISLFEARAFLSENATIFCSKQNVVDELISCLQLIDETVKMLGFEHFYVLNEVKPKKPYTKERINTSVAWLTDALNRANLQFIIDKDDSCLYDKESFEFGPRVQVYIVDALGRKWKGPFVQVNLSTVDFLSLYYIDENGENKAPIMICRSYFSSLEQLVGLLIEHYAGLLPLWLQKCQIKILPLATRNRNYANLVLDRLTKNGFRASIDKSTGKLGEKVHKAEKEKIPYMLIVGDNEEKVGTVTVRTCKHDADCPGLKLDSFLENLKEFRS